MPERLYKHCNPKECAHAQTMDKSPNIRCTLGPVNSCYDFGDECFYRLPRQDSDPRPPELVAMVEGLNRIFWNNPRDDQFRLPLS